MHHLDNRWIRRLNFKKQRITLGPLPRYTSIRMRKVLNYRESHDQLIQNNKWYKYKLYLRRYLAYRFLTSFHSIRKLRSLCRRGALTQKFMGLFESQPVLLLIRSGLLPSAKIIRWFFNRKLILLNNKPLKYLSYILKPSDSLTIDMRRLGGCSRRMLQYFFYRLRAAWMWQMYLRKSRMTFGHDLTPVRWSFSYLQTNRSKFQVVLLKRPQPDLLPATTFDLPTTDFYSKILSM